jgi:hypothetical protein
MIFASKNINKFSAAHGKIGTASVLTKSGKKKFMERWKVTILAHHVMALLTPNVQATIKIQKNLFQWIDPLFNKIVVNGCLLLNETPSSCVLMFKQMFMPSLLKSRPSNLSIMLTILSNGIQPWNLSALQLSRKYPACTMILNTSWITSMHL